MSKLFIINGKGGSGKTKFENMILQIANSHKKNVLIGSTIDWIKILAKNFGYNGEKTLKDRKMLCDFKDLLTKYNDSPYQHICQIIKDAWVDSLAIFIDCREPQEIQRFVNDWNAKTILIKRNTIDFYGNTADDNVNNYKYDIIIDNNMGLDELWNKAHNFYDTYVRD